MNIPRYEPESNSTGDFISTPDGAWCKWEDVEQALEANRKLFRLVLANVTDATPLDRDAEHEGRLRDLGIFP